MGSEYASRCMLLLATIQIVEIDWSTLSSGYQAAGQHSGLMGRPAEVPYTCSL